LIRNFHGTQGIALVRCKNTNCFLLETHIGVVMVDAGWHTSTNTVVLALEKNGFSPEDVSVIVLTHAHFDHFDFAEALQKRTNASIAAHREDVPFFEKGGAGIFPAHINHWIHKWEKLAKNRIFAAGVRIDIVLEDGDNLGGWEILHTPGHTPGTISLYSALRSVLITGGWAIPGLSQDQGHKPLVGYISCDPNQIAASRRRLADLEFETLLCSHFSPRLFPLFARLLRATAQPPGRTS